MLMYYSCMVGHVAVTTEGAYTPHPFRKHRKVNTNGLGKLKDGRPPHQTPFLTIDKGERVPSDDAQAASMQVGRAGLQCRGVQGAMRLVGRIARARENSRGLQERHSSSSLYFLKAELEPHFFVAGGQCFELCDVVQNLCLLDFAAGEVGAHLLSLRRIHLQQL